MECHFDVEGRGRSDYRPILSECGEIRPIVGMSCSIEGIMREDVIKVWAQPSQCLATVCFARLSL